jgi:putative transposase
MVTQLVEAQSVPVTVACAVIDLPRSSWYYVSRPTDDAEDRRIEDFLRDCVARRPRRGFGKCFTRARRMGYDWNHKRVYRVYKALGLNLRRRVKHRLPARVKQPLVAPLSPNAGWSMDFMSDRLTNGRQFRTLNLIDEFNREALAIEVDTSMPSTRVIRVLEQVKSWRTLPQSIRVDNGPEFIAEALSEWCEHHGIELNFIPPGKPQKNGYVERFNRSFREDILDCYLFESLDEVRDMAWEWQIEYNEERSHESLNNLTPVEYRQRYENQLAEVSRN